MTLPESFKLELVTPEGIIFSGEAYSCQAPGESGRFQILPGHTGLISSLSIGLLKIDTIDKKEHFISLSGGFLEVEEDKIVILSDSAELAPEIDVERAKKAKDRAEDRLENPQPDTDLERAEAALKRALNRLKIAELKMS